MRAIHKRSESWDDCPFTTLEEAADWIGEQGLLLEDAGSEPLEIEASVSTEDRDYRDLNLDELRQLSKAVPLSEITVVVVSAGTYDQPVRTTLSIVQGRGFSMKSEVSGNNLVAVDGINVWIGKQIAERFERIEQAKALAEAKEKPSAASPDAGEPLWRQVINHPWSIQIFGGLLAAVLASVVILLIR